MKTRQLFPLLMLAFLLSGILPACSNAQTHELAMAPLDQMPAEVQSAPSTVRQAYQFAVANSELMQQIPCYCGCGAMGHTSNYSCYVENVEQDGSITFDKHALSCSICVDITQDVMRLQREGTSVQDTRAYIDSTYSRYGTSNIP